MTSRTFLLARAGSISDSTPPSAVLLPPACLPLVLPLRSHFAGVCFRFSHNHPPSPRRRFSCRQCSSPQPTRLHPAEPCQSMWPVPAWWISAHPGGLPFVSAPAVPLCVVCPSDLMGLGVRCFLLDRPRSGCVGLAAALLTSRATADLALRTCGQASAVRLRSLSPSIRHVAPISLRHPRTTSQAK